MKIVKGNKLAEVDLTGIRSAVEGFEHIIIDLGCGDGRFVYKNALANPKKFYIGIDPAIKQVEAYSRKVSRKKLNNVMYVIGSIEILPEELSGLADELFIILPWGSLLKAVVHPTNEVIEKLKSLLKPKGKLTTIFGYNPDLEPSEISRLVLDTLDAAYVKSEIITAFSNNGLVCESFGALTAEELTQIESSWGKRISIRSDRQLFRLVFVK